MRVLDVAEDDVRMRVVLANNMRHDGARCVVLYLIVLCMELRGIACAVPAMFRTCVEYFGHCLRVGVMFFLKCFPVLQGHRW